MRHSNQVAFNKTLRRNWFWNWGELQNLIQTKLLFRECLLSQLHKAHTIWHVDGPPRVHWLATHCTWQCSLSRLHPIHTHIISSISAPQLHHFSFSPWYRKYLSNVVQGIFIQYELENNHGQVLSFMNCLTMCPKNSIKEELWKTAHTPLLLDDFLQSVYLCHNYYFTP